MKVREFELTQDQIEAAAGHEVCPQLLKRAFWGEDGNPFHMRSNGSSMAAATHGWRVDTNHDGTWRLTNDEVLYSTTVTKHSDTFDFTASCKATLSPHQASELRRCVELADPALQDLRWAEVYTRRIAGVVPGAGALVDAITGEIEAIQNDRSA